MNKKSAVLNFPEMEYKSKRKIKNLDTFKYFNERQIKLLRRAVRQKAEFKGNLTDVREWMIIDLLTQTGLRVSEAANLRCEDLKIGYGESKIFVREGKGALYGHIVISESLKRHLKQFL